MEAIVGDNGTVGTVYFNTAFDTKSYDKCVSSTLKNTENAFSKSFGKIGKLVGTALATTAVVKFTKSCLELGSNLAEVQNVVDVSFPKMNKHVNAFAKNSITQFGLSEKMAKQYMGTFGAMSKSFGFSEESAYEMSKTMTGLVGDVASFYNISQDLAAVKLKAVWTGETEGLKDLGVVMTQTALNEYAMQKGIGKTIDKMSEAEKVALRYSFVQDKLSGAMGDFARTSDSWANQTRVLSLRFEQLKATLGQGFITLFTPIIKGINTVLAGLQKVAEVFTYIISKIFGKQAEAVSNVSTDYVSLGESAMDSANDVVSASKKAQKAVMGYDKLNILSNKKDTGKSGSSGAGGSISTIPSISSPEIIDNTSPIVDKMVDNIIDKFNKIKTKTIEAWNSRPVQAFVSAVKTGGNFIWNLWKTLGSNLITNVSETWSNIKGNISLTLSNVSELWTIFWTDIQNGIETWGQPLIDGVSNIFNSIWQDAINPYIQTISQAWADFSGILVDLWNEHGKPLIDNIGEFCTKTIELFQSIWDNVLEPIVTPFLETLSWLWDKHISGMIETIGDFVGKLVNDALEIYNKFIQPIVKFLLEILSPAWTFLSSIIIGTFGNVFAFLCGKVSSILKTFGGIIDFITGIFTGNWRKAWNGIVSIFEGIIGGIANVFKLPFNVIITGINSFIKALNKIKIPDWVPDWMGGGRGFNIPEIPKLAEGGWFEARNPRLAIIGEGKHNEIVAPEPKLDEAIDKGFARHGGTGGTQKLEMTIYVVYEDGKKIIKKINDEQIKEGKILLDV